MLMLCRHPSISDLSDLCGFGPEQMTQRDRERVRRIVGQVAAIS